MKWTFGQREIIVDKHLYGPYGWMPSLGKVDVIQEIKEELESQIKVQRFLGAYMHFTTFWIAYYAYMAKPLYRLPKKGRKFKWEIDCMLCVYGKTLV